MVPHLPPTSPSRAADRVATVLAWGFRISAAMIAIGLLLALLDRQPLDAHLPRLEDLLRDIRSIRSSGFLALGVIAMLLTPVVASVALAITFVQERDMRYARLSGLVVLILGISLALSLR